MGNFFVRLHDQSLSLDFEDILVWVDTKNGIFSIKSFYSFVASSTTDPFSYGIV